MPKELPEPRIYDGEEEHAQAGRRRPAAVSLTPEQRALRSRLAAHTSWAKTADPTERTAAARRAFESRFEREVDPDGVLPEQERARRAKAAKSAYFARLALKSSVARARRAR